MLNVAISDYFFYQYLVFCLQYLLLSFCRPELAIIWKRLNAHALFLKEHNILLTEEVKDMLATLLIMGRNKQDGMVSAHIIC